eukprot:scaffold3692_cov178-Chaetoceros_neogracile.AAC.8
MEPQFSTVALDPIKASEITALLKTFAPDLRISSPKIMRPDKWYNKYTIDQSSLEQPLVSRISISWGETVRSVAFEFLKLGKMVSHVFCHWRWVGCVISFRHDFFPARAEFQKKEGYSRLLVIPTYYRYDI